MNMHSQSPLQPGIRKRRMNMHAWNRLTSVAAAVVLVTSASMANSFSLSTQPPFPQVKPRKQLRNPQQDAELYSRPLTGDKGKASRSQSQATLLRPMRTQLGTVAEQKSDVLVLQKAARSKRRGMDAEELEELYLRSATTTTTATATTKTTTSTKPKPKKTSITKATAATPISSTGNAKAARSDLVNVPLESIKDVHRRKRATTTSTTATTTRKNRSSTMPGLSGSAMSDRQIAYRDGVRLVEQRTGKKIKDTANSRAKRRAASGESMYKTSACVPDSMVQFAGEIHREDRITRTEEISLGEKTQEAIQLQNLYDKLADTLAREPTDEEWCAAAGKINMEAIRQTIEEGLEAKNKLVTSNLRMVQSVVNTYIRNGLSGQYNAGDMMQEGIMALIRAAEKFEPDRGWRFSTYALYWIRSSVKRTQIFQSRIVTVPQRLYENHKRLLRVEKEMIHLMGRKPTKKELGESVGMSELQVTRCMTAMEQRCYSLDAEITNMRKPMSGDNNGDTLHDLVESRTDDCEHLKLKRVLLREDVIETLNRHLSPEEVELLLLRYGLKDGHNGNRKLGSQLTIAELSEMVGLKPDKVRRIINRSLRQLKTASSEEWLALSKEM
jgi:RNA polymerase sigma factor (sigma-70 family)